MQKVREVKKREERGRFISHSVSPTVSHSFKNFQFRELFKKQNENDKQNGYKKYQQQQK
jgi:hypothetical protein